MAKFFVTNDKISDNKILILNPDAHHIARSLRMAEGDEIIISNGEGREYRCTLAKIRDTECECEIIEPIDTDNESPIEITLCMAYPKGDKLEVVVQKAVELGASRIVPFESSRCIKRPKTEKIEKQSTRLSRIAEEAAKQCGRSRIPEVTPPVSYSEMLKIAKNSELSLFCYENENDKSLKDALNSGPMPRSISVIVGSEGGFSSDEAALAYEAGIQPVSLGKRILRCETAPTFVLSAICYKFEL